MLLNVAPWRPIFPSPSIPPPPPSLFRPFRTPPFRLCSFLSLAVLNLPPAFLPAIAPISPKNPARLCSRYRSRYIPFPRVISVIYRARHIHKCILDIFPPSWSANVSLTMISHSPNRWRARIQINHIFSYIICDGSLVRTRLMSRFPPRIHFSHPGSSTVSPRLLRKVSVCSYSHRLLCVQPDGGEANE